MKKDVLVGYLAYLEWDLGPAFHTLPKLGNLYRREMVIRTCTCIQEVYTIHKSNY